MKLDSWIKHSDAIKDEKNPLTQDDIDKVWTLSDIQISTRLVLVDATALPTNYSLLPNMAAVRDDQGDLGLCFAFAGCGILEYFIKNNPPLNVVEELSELFLGYWSRFICEGGAPEGDNGSTIIATMQAMQQYGVCLGKLWAYVDNNENVKPPAAALADGKNMEVGKYFAIPDDSNKITAIKQAVYAGSPIMFGCDVHESIMNVGSDGIEPYASPSSRTDPIAGGHARFIIGWDDTKVIKGTSTKGAFLVMNSWSSGWGANGTSWISYQTWKDQETDDMGITSLITPTPGPGPVTPVPPVTPIDYPTVYTNAQAIIWSPIYTTRTKVSQLKVLIPQK